MLTAPSACFRWAKVYSTFVLYVQRNENGVNFRVNPNPNPNLAQGLPLTLCARLVRVRVRVRDNGLNMRNPLNGEGWLKMKNLFSFLEVIFFFFLSLMSYTRTKKSRAQSEKHCPRRGASSGQKTRGCIEGEQPLLE